MSTTAHDDTANPGETVESLADRLDTLEVATETLDAKVAQMVETRLEQVETTLDDHRQRIESLEATVEQQQSHIDSLEETLAGLAGLQETEQTTAAKRRRDLLVALQRKAEGDDGRASMTYSDVLDQWAVLGHGQLAPTQAYRAMERVAAVDGVAYTTNRDGQQVVRIDVADFDTSTAFDRVNDVHNAQSSHQSQNAVSHNE